MHWMRSNSDQASALQEVEAALASADERSAAGAAIAASRQRLSSQSKQSPVKMPTVGAVGAAVGTRRAVKRRQQRQQANRASASVPREVVVVPGEVVGESQPYQQAPPSRPSDVEVVMTPPTNSCCVIM